MSFITICRYPYLRNIKFLKFKAQLLWTVLWRGCTRNIIIFFLRLLINKFYAWD